MIYTIENDQLKISADTAGAQLMSVYSKKTETEYLWQSDPAYWTGRAYNLFPFIGRMYEGVFTYGGKTYPSRAHGLARYFEFTLEEQTETSLTFVMKDSEETNKEYPFSFEFRVYFELCGNTLTTRYTVTNTDSRELLCAFGGHPGINVPFGGKQGDTSEAFEDYYLEFDRATDVKQQLLGEKSPYMIDKSVPYPLENGVRLPLSHELFSNDAVILENTSGCVSLRSAKSARYVTMHYEGFPFIGFWQILKAGAPYVCLEPWSALPAVRGKIVELETKPHMTRVAPDKTASMAFTLEIHE